MNLKLLRAQKRSSGNGDGRGGPRCFSVREFQWFLERDRERTDRTGVGFSLLVLSSPPGDTHHRLLKCAVALMHGRLRMPDVVGWLDEDSIGAILPATTAEGAWRVADDICSEFARDNAQPRCRVYYYPTDWFMRDSGRNGHAEEQIDGKHPVDAMETLFVKPLPIWKRAIDIVGALAGLTLTLPLLAIAAVAIKATSRGPVIYGQRRAGIGGRPFVMRKLRSMVSDADEIKAALMSANEQDGPAFKIKNDPRITPVGRFLRRTSIDELPQLWNVLVGEMSLVGPRPLMHEETPEESWQRRRLEVTPGLTCIWQVRGRSQVRFADWMRMDMQYLRLRSFFQDLKLILQTIPAVLLRKGAA